jgi:carboxymethylenebutenolidase
LGRNIELTAADLFQLSAYRADPIGRPRGGVVLIQEIFGVNHHIRSVCDRLAAAGYAVLAPALFDRQKRGFESGYTRQEIDAARKFVEKPDFAAMLSDTQAAVTHLRDAGKVAVVGFCLGGSVAFAAAGQLTGLSSAVAYYGGQIAKLVNQRPKVQVMMHFGAVDPYIPSGDINLIAQNCPGCEIHVYEGAAHGFNCDERNSYDKRSADLAWGRTLEFLRQSLEQAGNP